MSPTAAPRNHAHHRYAVQMRLMRWGKFVLPVVAVGLGVAIFYLARVEAGKNVIPIGAEHGSHTGGDRQRQHDQRALLRAAITAIAALR